MRITTYTTRLDGDRITGLVKESAKNYEGSRIMDSPESAAAIFESVFDLSNRTQELFCMAALGGGREVKGVFEITRGTLTSSLVHPREVFAPAMLAGAASIIVVHNHPSGFLNISEQDREVSRTIKQAGELLGIRLDDHLVIGADGSFASAM